MLIQSKTKKVLKKCIFSILYTQEKKNIIGNIIYIVICKRFCLNSVQKLTLNNRKKSINSDNLGQDGICVFRTHKRQGTGVQMTLKS